MSIAVPVIWTHGAAGRMVACMQKAMQATKFGSDGRSACNIFIMNEAEAHAVYALHNNECGLNVRHFLLHGLQALIFLAGW